MSYLGKSYKANKVWYTNANVQIAQQYFNSQCPFNVNYDARVQKVN